MHIQMQIYYLTKMANQINEEDKILSSMMQQLVAHQKKKKKTSTFPHSIHKILFGGGA